MPYLDESTYDMIHVSEGSHDMVIYSFHDRGLIEDNYNGETKEVHKAYVKFEVLDERLPNEEKFGDRAAKRLTFWHGVNISHAPNANLTKLRERVLGLDPQDRDARKYFDENDFLGIRCKVFIEHNKNGWPVLVSIKVHEDQAYGELENEFSITAVDKDPAGVNTPAQTNAQAKPQTSAQPARPTPQRPQSPAPKADSRSPKEVLNDGKEYFNLLVATCVENGLMDNAGAWSEWVENPELTIEELKENIKAFQDTIKQSDCSLPEVEKHPLSTGDDDLPF